jgi:hypothetical protein
MKNPFYVLIGKSQRTKLLGRTKGKGKDNIGNGFKGIGCYNAECIQLP